jgi:hypothetical protein
VYGLSQVDGDKIYLLTVDLPNIHELLFLVESCVVSLTQECVY